MTVALPAQSVDAVSGRDHPADGVAAERDITVGSSQVGISAIVVGLANYAFSIALVWQLRAVDYSIFATGQAVLLTIATAAGAGIPWVLSREIATAPDDTGARRQATSFALMTGTAQALMSAVIAALVMSHFGSVPVIAATAAAAFVIGEAAIVAGYIQGNRRFGTVATLRIVEVVVKIGSGFALYLRGAGSAGFLAGFCIGSGAIVAYGGWVMRHDLLIRVRAIADGRLWRDAIGMLAVQAGVAILFSLDIIVAALCTGPGQALAGYQTALIVSRVPLFLSVATAVVTFPVIAAGSTTARAAAVRASMALFVKVTIPTVMVIATVPGALLTIGLPAGYSNVQHVLATTAIVGGLLGALNLITTYFQATQRFAACVAVVIAGIAMQCVLLITGDHVGGVLGLARADALGCTIIVGALLVLVRRQWHSALRGLMRVAIVALAMTAPLLLLRQVVLLWLIYAAVVGAALARTLLISARTVPYGGRARILHLAFEEHRQPGSGGGAIRTSEINRRLAHTYDVTVVAARYPGSRARIEDGVQYRHIGWSLGHFGSLLTYFACIPWALIRYPSDLVVEDFAAPFSSVLVPLFTARPTVAVCQWLFAREKSRQYRLPFFMFEEIGVRLHRTIVAVSGDLGARLQSMNRRATVTVIPNGVVAVAAHPSSIPVEQRRDLLFLGRLEIAQKGIDMLIQAFALAADRIPGDLLIAGDGVDEHRVRELVGSHQLGGRVRFLSRVDGRHKQRLLAEAGMVCMPSRYETFGMVALEALAVGTPVVGFDIPCLREVVPPACGVLVPAFDVHALADAIVDLDHDPQRRRELGSRGMFLAKEFCWDDLAGRQATVYRAAMLRDAASTVEPPKAPLPIVYTGLDDVLNRAVGHGRRTRRVVLLGNYGNGNAGDEAILLGVVERIPDRASVTVVSRNPEQITRDHDIAAVPMVSWRTIRTVLHSDAVLIGGGGIFGAGMQRLPSLLPLTMIAARLLGKQTALVAVGAYDDMPTWVMVTLRVAARMSSVVSVRDSASYETLNHRVLGKHIQPVRVHDPAIALHPSSPEQARRLLAAAGVPVADAPLVLSIKPMLDPEARCRVLATLTVAVDWWCIAQRGDVVLLALSDQGDYGLGGTVTDMTMAHELVASSSHPHRLHPVGPNLHPRDAKAITGIAAAVVAMRLHAQIFAHSMSTPVWGITFEKKTTSFLTEIGAPSSPGDAGGDRLVAWLDMVTR